MLKALWRDSVAYSLGRAVTAALGIVLLPLYTAHLAPQQYGLFDMGSAAISLATLLVALEVAQGAARLYCDDQNAARRREYFSTALLFTLGAFVVLCVATLLVAPSAARLALGPGAGRDTLLLVLTAAALASAFKLGLAQLRWMLRPRAFLACSLAQVAVGTAVAAALVVVWNYGAHGLFWGLIVGYSAGLALSLWLGRAGLSLTFSTARLREMLAFSIPLVTSSGAVWVALYVDRLAIRELMTLADVGRYGVAYRFASVVDILMIGFDSAFVPLLYANYRDPNTNVALAKLLRILVVAGSGILLLLAAISHELLHVLADPAYHGAAPLVPVLAASVLLTRLGSVGPGLWIANRTGIIAAINIAVAVSNLALNLLLIPRIGVIGAALATAASSLLGFTVNMVASQRHYPAPHAWHRLWLGGLIAAFGLTALLWLARLFAPLSASGIATKTLIAVFALLLVAAAVLRAEEWKDLATLLRRVKA